MSSYNGKYVVAFAPPGQDNIIASGSINNLKADSSGNWISGSYTGKVIANGEVELKVWEVNKNTLENYTGSGTKTLSILIMNTATLTQEDLNKLGDGELPAIYHHNDNKTASFSSGTGTVAW
jgi:hypothetical protein